MREIKSAEEKEKQEKLTQVKKAKAAAAAAAASKAPASAGTPKPQVKLYPVEVKLVGIVPQMRQFSAILECLKVSPAHPQIYSLTSLFVARCTHKSVTLNSLMKRRAPPLSSLCHLRQVQMLS